MNGGVTADRVAAIVAQVHIGLTRFAVAIREAFEAITAAARIIVKAMDDLIRHVRAWQKVMRRRVRWLDRGRPAPLAVDGHAYRLRQRRRRARK